MVLFVCGLIRLIGDQGKGGKFADSIEMRKTAFYGVLSEERAPQPPREMDCVIILHGGDHRHCKYLGKNQFCRPPCFLLPFFAFYALRIDWQKCPESAELNQRSFLLLPSLEAG